jgi:hypothetical protein
MDGLLHDSFWTDEAFTIVETHKKLKFEVQEHPVRSPDLAPSD